MTTYDFGTNPYDATVEYSMQDDVVNASVGLPEGGTRKGTLLLVDKDGFDGTIYDAAVENDYVGLGSEWEIEPEMSTPFSRYHCRQ